MSNYVNQVDKDNVLYDIHDIRIPEASSTDEGKAVIAKNDGTFVLQDVTVDAYTKAETDALLVEKADTVNVYTKAEVDALVEPKADTTAVEAGLALKANTSTVDAALALKADANNVYTKAEADVLLSSKQDTLVSGTNIKTINNQSILGEGNIDIQGVSDYDDLENIPIINQHEEREPALVPFVIDETVIHNGDKIHFATDVDSTAALVSALKTLGSGALVMASESLQLMCMVIDDDVYMAILDGRGVPIALYGTSAGEIEGLVFEQGWQNIDADGNFTITLAEDALVGLVGDSPSEPLWNGTLISLVGEVVSIEPTPVDGKYYKRPDGDLYKYTEEITPAHLDALVNNQEVHKGWTIRFNKEFDIDTFLGNISFPSNTPVVQLYYIELANSEGDSVQSMESLGIINAGASKETFGENAEGILVFAGYDQILYATESGAIAGMDAVTGEPTTIEYTQGWNSNYVSADGDFTPAFISLVIDENPHYGTFNNGILELSAQLDQAEWNGILVGINVPATSTPSYDKVVLQSEVLPDSKDAKNLDVLRVKITPQEVGFIDQVETVTGGTTNDIFINTNATIDFSKFNFTDSLDGIPCEELIKLNFPAKTMSFGVNLGDRLYKVYGDGSYMTDTDGTSIANICSSYWTLVNNPQIDNNGFYFVEVLSSANGSQSKSPLRLYKFDNDGSDVWVLIYNCESSMNYDLYNNYWFWSSDNFSITVDGNTIDFIQGDRNNSMPDSMYFNDDVQLAISTSLFNNFLFVSPASYFDIVAANYEGVQMLVAMIGMGSEDYDMSSEGIIWSSVPIEGGTEPGWSPDLEYAQGSHENGIISYLRGFLTLVTSGGESIIGEDDPVPNNITYVSSNPAVHDIFGASRDVEVLVPEKKEIGWGMPFPDIKKVGQVLMTAGDEYALTYDNYQATHGVITAVDGFTFNTGLDQATVDINVTTLGMRALEGLSPIKAASIAPSTEYNVAFTMAVPLANFEVGQTIGEYAGMFIDTSKFSDMKAYLNNLGLTSGSPDYPLLVVDNSGTSINALYATYDTDNSRVALMTSGGQEILNTDDESYDHDEPFAGLENGATVTNIYDGAAWNGVFFYLFEESEGSMEGAILGSAKDLTTETSTTKIMYSTVTGDAVIMNTFVEGTADMYMVVHNLEHRWYEENFDLLNFSGVCQFQIDDDYRGGESIYGVLVTLQPGVFYGDIGNAHVEWGEAEKGFDPSQLDTTEYGNTAYFLVQDQNNKSKRLSKNVLPEFTTGTIYLYGGNWQSYDDYYRYEYSFSHSVYDNDTLMIAPSRLEDAVAAQEANIFFASCDSGSSTIYFYASNASDTTIMLSYSFTHKN